MASSPDLNAESIDEDIEEDIDATVSPEPDATSGAIMDSMGTSSMGVDASVNSMTLEGYDHVEPVSRAI
jgi:hypothetical protein